MNKLKIILTFISLIFTIKNYSQETILLKNKPKAIIRSWHPEFKEFPKLKISESKVLYVVIPSFEKINYDNYKIKLTSSDKDVQIEENEKNNQYLVTINRTKEKNVEFDIWFSPENRKIKIHIDSEWKSITNLYPKKDNYILLDKIKLNLIN